MFSLRGFAAQVLVFTLFSNQVSLVH